MKICSKCKAEKDLSLFNKMSKSIDGLRPDCKECRSIETKMYRSSNPEKIKSNNHKFYNLDKDGRKEYHEVWRGKNREKLRELSKLSYRKNLDINREKRNKYVKNKRDNDILYKLRNVYRCRINIFLKSSSINTLNKTSELLGCSYIELKEHLEKQFIDGMDWSNHGLWHIDHIKPLSLAKNESELICLCNYKNLQPLLAKDNLIKGNKIY